MTKEQIKELRALVQIASNLIADDLTDCDESSAPEHFRFLKRAAVMLNAEDRAHDGISGQDRESYSDDQDRDSYYVPE